MSRLYRAIQRASQVNESTETSPTDGAAPVAAGEDALTQFVAGEDSPSRGPYPEESANTSWVLGQPDSRAVTAQAESAGQQEPDDEPTGNGGALVARSAALPVTTVARDDSRDDVQVRELMSLLWRRRWLIAAVVAASLIASWAYNFQAKRIYEARARLIVDPDSPQVVPFRPLTEDTSRFDYYVTQVEVLRSRGLARKTLEQLHLLGDGPDVQSSQVSQLLGALTVTPFKSDVGESRVINLVVTSETPELAARLANGLAQTYVDQNLETRRQGSRDASQWLTERLAELRGQVNSSEGALQQYRERKDAVSLDDRQNIVVQKLGQLNAAVTTARAERVEKETLYQQLSAIQKSGAPLDTFPAILANNFIQGLKADLANLQREREQLAEKVGDLHPDMIKVNTAIDSAERRLNAEMAKVVEGVKNDYKNAKAREEGLLAALDDQKREVLDLNQKSIGYSALQRDATSTHQVFDSVLQRVKETELSGQLQSNNVRILDAAEVPRRPIWPRTWVNLLVALLGGGFAAVGLALGMEYLNPRINNEDDLEDALGMPVLGIAPRIAALKSGPLTVDRLSPEFQESLRDIRTRILLSPSGAGSRSLALTSATVGEGKTVFASGLAGLMAMAGRRVLLIDADMHRPQLDRVFGVSPSPGLSNVLKGEIEAHEAVRETAIKGLYVLPAGSDVGNPSELLHSKSLSILIRGLGQIFDLVVLDCPPVMAVADASIIANAASSVVFVVGADSTSRAVVKSAIARLTSVQAQVVGVVLNKAKVDRRTKYLYQYRH